MKNTGNMKLTRSLLILTAALAAVSCQQKAETPSEGEFVDISLTAGIPGAIGTYADGDASSSDAFSHQGGALNVDHEQLDLQDSHSVTSRPLTRTSTRLLSPSR